MCAERSVRTTWIRAAVSADLPCITECVQAAYSHWVPLMGREPWPMQQDYAKVLEEEHVFVIEVEEKLVGILALCETEDGLLVENVAVLPSHRGLGVGKALLIHAEQQAAFRGYRSLYLYTNEKM